MDADRLKDVVDSGRRVDGLPAPRADLQEMLDWFTVRFTGMVAEADLRGMTPMAVFFEWLDELGEISPEHATAIVVSLPIPTRIEYRQWRDGRAIGECGADPSS